MTRTFLLSTLLLGTFLLASPTFSFAQDEWPLVLESDQGTVTIYQPQPELYEGNILSSRAAVSVRTKNGSKEPIFGAIWCESTLEVDRDTRMAILKVVKITDARFPSVADRAEVEKLKNFLNAEVPDHVAPFSIDRLIASMEQDISVTDPYSMAPPEVIYRNEPSTLVLIDGDPIWQAMENSEYQRVVNTPFLIARKGTGSTLYMGSSTFWYTGVKVTGPWLATTEVPEELKKLQESATPPDTDGEMPKPLSAPSIVVRTTPAELVQTDGEASFVPMEGTGLLYVENTQDDIFMDITGQDYYILTTGRWFRSKDLSQGPWTHVPADKLPAEFALIPEGSDKDGVLSSVAGTKAAREAVLDAQIPQTARVDRSTTITVQYDGEPQFRSVDGTDVAYAANSSTTVLLIKGRYYAVDNGIWFDGASANGPWTVATEAPDEVQDIPPTSPVYNVKYVDVYETTPDVVYVGYTPGYTGSYIYGPTVIYGTGFHYLPWYGAYYYPRPVTYGFGMHYNPWTGWSMGFSMSFGWFNYGYGGYPHYGGWWGPPRYCPPHYHHPPHGGGGYYGPRPPYGGGHRPGGGHPSYGGGNIYDRTRPGVTPSRPVERPSQPSGPTSRPGQPNTLPANKPNAPETRPSTMDVSRPNNVFADPEGNIYQRDKKENWQRYNTDGKWKNEGRAPAMPSTRPSDPGTRPAMPSTRPSSPPINQMERQYQNRDRGQQRVNNYQQYQRPQSRPSAPPARMPAGGGRTMPTPSRR